MDLLTVSLLQLARPQSRQPGTAPPGGPSMSPSSRGRLAAQQGPERAAPVWAKPHCSLRRPARALLGPSHACRNPPSHAWTFLPWRPGQPGRNHRRVSEPQIAVALLPPGKGGSSSPGPRAPSTHFGSCGSESPSQDCILAPTSPSIGREAPLYPQTCGMREQAMGRQCGTGLGQISRLP